MDFEFDPAKSASNRVKHGIDFAAAQAIWDDADRLEIPGRIANEARFLVIGQVGGVLWAACVTYREGRIRIISVRRARNDEKEAYDER
jgi:uncharacterized protein